jgi:hypothetical protein
MEGEDPDALPPPEGEEKEARGQDGGPLREQGGRHGAVEASGRGRPSVPINAQLPPGTASPPCTAVVRIA